jgi:hypothetical protein
MRDGEAAERRLPRLWETTGGKVAVAGALAQTRSHLAPAAVVEEGGGDAYAARASQEVKVVGTLALLIRVGHNCVGRWRWHWYRRSRVRRRGLKKQKSSWARYTKGKR